MNASAHASATPSASSLFAQRGFALFFAARGCSNFAYQMSAVSIGWQVYAITHSALALGLIGLAQFLPVASLTFLAGHAADRYERVRVVQICEAVLAITAAFLAWGSRGHWLSVTEIFTVVTLMGAARAFESPAMGALLPALVPPASLQKASALSASVFQAATVLGPALGGFIYALAPGAAYLVIALAWGLAAVLNGLIRVARTPQQKAPPSITDLFAGIGFVRANPAILGAISLDLFAVLLGGATALLPLYARDILHTGPWGLGILRAAPAAGALLMSVYLARYPLARKTGLRMFQGVIIYGMATLVFGLSRFLPLSLLALLAMGAGDMVSVVIRVTLVQMRTPDDMRGRVSAVNFLFVNASNQLGEFESGLTAALLGAVPAVLLGGLGTLAVALAWMRLFPALREVETLE